ncbi:polyphosphate kinase 2 [Neorhizobium alkalisoli]|uniref:ADP/GDP-polyphosphate phosphotransferase n=1 Tax=Neorhizobium alkalisoli TaxID=528178 RepID=A0A561QRZ6_9HYPH|nr:polyphosphate kinase 2 [Neorhizobium alkalisoli]
MDQSSRGQSSQSQSSRAVQLVVGEKMRTFDIDDPKLPDWVDDGALPSGGYPYDDKMDKDKYEKQLEKLQIELVKVQFWMQATGKRMMALFEGRDAAGKGGTIFSIRSYINPRSARVVALAKPSETEAGQWYFQRYVSQFPSKGEIVLFDRSWYNRAVVEPVMGFCTPKQYDDFMKATPQFEEMVADDGIHLFKFWLDIGQEMQLKRFHDRRHDPLKIWKLSPMDIAALNKWPDYTAKRDRMLRDTHTKQSPWTVVLSNDKRRAHLNVIRHILLSLDYDGKDKKAIGEIDDKVLGFGPKFLK